MTRRGCGRCRRRRFRSGRPGRRTDRLRAARVRTVPVAGVPARLPARRQRLRSWTGPSCARLVTRRDRSGREGSLRRRGGGGVVVGGGDLLGDRRREVLVDHVVDEVRRDQPPAHDHERHEQHDDPDGRADTEAEHRHVGQRSDHRPAEGEQERSLVLERCFEDVRLDQDQYEHDHSDQRCDHDLRAGDRTEQARPDGSCVVVGCLRRSRCLGAHGGRNLSPRRSNPDSSLRDSKRSALEPRSVTSATHRPT